MNFIFYYWFTHHNCQILKNFIERNFEKKNYFKRNETFEKFFINRFIGFGREMFSAMWNWTAQEYFTNNIKRHPNRSPTTWYAKMWCWWPICYVGDMKFNLGPNSIKFLASVNESRGTYIGHRLHYKPECDVGNWYVGDFF